MRAHRTLGTRVHQCSRPERSGERSRSHTSCPGSAGRSPSWLHGLLHRRRLRDLRARLPGGRDRRPFRWPDGDRRIRPPRYRRTDRSHRRGSLAGDGQQPEEVQAPAAVDLNGSSTGRRCRRQGAHHRRGGGPSGPRRCQRHPQVPRQQAERPAASAEPPHHEHQEQRGLQRHEGPLARFRALVANRAPTVGPRRHQHHGVRPWRLVTPRHRHIHHGPPSDQGLPPCGSRLHGRRQRDRGRLLRRLSEDLERDPLRDRRRERPHQDPAAASSRRRSSCDREPQRSTGCASHSRGPHGLRQF